MGRGSSFATLTPEEAAPLLGMDKTTLMRALQEGHFRDFGEAFKTNKDNECWSYEIYKYPLFTRLGIDVALSINRVLELVKDGAPPWLDQTKVASHYRRESVSGVVNDLIGQQKKDA